MRFVSIASGSSGNCTYIGTDHTHLLVDAGISCKRIDTGVHELGIKPDELAGVLITHEHSDHISGIRVFSKKHHVPLYGTKETLEAIERMDVKKEIDPDLYRPVRADEQIVVGDFTVTPFSNSHDAANPVGYRAEADGHAVGVVTDLGVYSQYTINHLLGLDAVLLEANHDVHMLEAGPYPFPLKRRILGQKGHLSNEAAGHLLNELLHDGMKHIVLGHLSKENNYAELAYETVCCEVNMSENPYNSGDFPITVARRDAMSEVIYI